jgi:hypothetical protein
MNNLSMGDFMGETPLVTGTPPQTPLLRPLRQPLYDREPIDTGANLVELFVDNKKNNAGTAKTERDTNMPGSGLLATPLEFALVGFQGHLELGTALADYQAIYNGGVFKWIFGQTTTWLTIKLMQIPQGIGPHGFYTQTAAANATLITHGWGVMNNIFSFLNHKKEARPIGSNESFKNQLSFPGGVTLSATVYWTTYMIGILKASL